MNGSIKDYLRRLDHVPRTVRGRLRDIAAAQLEGARTDSELAAATGLPADQVRKALAADGLRATSLDAGSGFADGGQTDYAEVLPDQDAASDVEGAAVLSDTLRAFLAVFDALSGEQQVILALVYHQEITDFAKVAGLLFTTEDRVRELHLAAVDRVHQALLRAVSPAEPAPLPDPVLRPGAGEPAEEGRRCLGPCGRVLPRERFPWNRKAEGKRAAWCSLCGADRQRQQREARKAAAVPVPG